VMRRRDFITLLGGAGAAWPMAAHAQAMPVIGFLSNASPDRYTNRLRAFREGETGYVEGKNVDIQYLWADDQNDRLPALATELVHRQVTVIVAAGGTPTALAAKAATGIIPIVFGVAADPVEVGLVASLSRPAGNLTGATSLNAEVNPKRLELLRELVPSASVVGVLVNPTNPVTDAFVRPLEAAGRTLGLELHVLQVSSEHDFDAMFTALGQRRIGALLISPDILFNAHSEQLAVLTVRHAVPAIFQYRPFAAAGGLMSYGASESEFYHVLGTYAARVLKGEKPADLPVQQPTKVELIINLKTAKTLGIDVPLSLLGRANEVIE
jgi:putative tryptophan/tyrosine transport system substrate-binding protein